MQNILWAIREYAVNLGHHPAGIIFNGDLVAYENHDSGDLDNFRKYYLNEIANRMNTKKKTDIALPGDFKVFLALGNHDYENNVDDTFRNRGATRLVECVIQNIEENGPFIKNSDYVCNPSEKYPPGYHPTKYRGSLAYSFDLCGIHFIMAHNYPRYIRQWDLKTDSGSSTILIQPSCYHGLPCEDFNWMEDDIKKTDGKLPIVLCVHRDVEDNTIGNEPSIKKVIENDISAVFTGHIHKKLGAYDVSKFNITTPCFSSGSSSQLSFLLLQCTMMDNEKVEMVVYQVKGDSLISVPTTTLVSSLVLSPKKRT